MNLKLKISIIIAVIITVVIGILFWNYLENKNDSNFQFDDDTRSTSVLLDNSYKKFTHPDYMFSVEYPEALQIERFSEKEGGETIVFQKDGDKKGLQIFISPFGKDEILTRERILEDLPGTLIKEPVEIVLGDGTLALLFWSEDPVIGNTREVWFTNSGYLYEITTYAELDLWLAKILSTWNFNTL